MQEKRIVGVLIRLVKTDKTVSTACVQNRFVSHQFNTKTTKNNKNNKNNNEDHKQT